MVRIRVFIPHLELKDIFEEVKRSLPGHDDIEIELCYVFGTPDYLTREWDEDILVARGMTYLKLHDAFPEKHVVEMKFGSFELMDALLRCRSEKRKHIALFFTNIKSKEHEMMEEICNAKISTYRVTDEMDAEQQVKKASLEGADVIVGAGTVCGICDKFGIPNVHIITRYDAVFDALTEAVNTAVSLNREREKSRIVRAVINNASSGLIAVDEHGVITVMNNQIYKMLNLSAFDTFIGKNIHALIEKLGLEIAYLDYHTEQEKVLKVKERNFYVHLKPYVEKDATTGALITVTNTDSIIREEDKVRRELASKGLTAKYHFKDILGKSAIMRENIRIAERYSKVNSNILIIGETGTGKELFAHSIHNSSLRANAPFVAINCAALPENLLESELFGYEAGAFSGASKNGKSGLFEQAHNGTIFLDEIGEMPITLQAKLLRVLQEKEVRRIGSTSVHTVNVRVISATNVNLEEKVKTGEFRADLYYRLDLLDIRIPPLRERKEDIEELFSSFLSRIATEMGRNVPHITEDAAAILRDYSWQGNVRELRNISERLMVLSDGDVVDADTLQLLNIFRKNIKKAVPDPSLKESSSPTIPEKESKSLMSQSVINTGKETAGKMEIIDDNRKKNKEELARELGISRTTLWRRMKQKKEKKG